MNWHLVSLSRSLVVRLVGISLLLLLIVQLASFAVVRSSIERNARSQITHTLNTDENVWRQLLEQNAERLRQGATLLAADYGFRTAVGSGDEQTIQSALENHGQRMGAAVAVLLNTQLQVVSVSDSASRLTYLERTLAQVVPRLSDGKSTSHTIILNGLPHQFVLVPMRAPVVVGWVLMGFPIHQTLANQMQQLLDVQVALRVPEANGEWSVPVSTLDAAGLAALRQQQGSNMHELSSGQTIWLVRASPLGDSQEGQPLAQALLLRSVDAVVAPYRQLQWLLAGITLTGLLLFAIGQGLMARWVITPLRSLVLGTQRISRGEYDMPVEHTERRDEIGLLARSFDRMRIDIAEQQAEIRHLAYWDRLTGLPNRERFRNTVLAAISAHADYNPEGTTLAVITLDLDRFKHVNDVLGHAFGDRLLQAVAKRLRGQMMVHGDMVARMGGNEFALLLRRTDAAAALVVARSITQAFEKPLAFGDQMVDLSAGIGIACWPQDASDVDTLLNRSEIAMYVAKRKLDGPQLYDPIMDSSSAQTLSLLTELRQAIERGELRLYLQPKVPLQGKPGLAAEALVRWQHPQRGLVPPMEFIPFAEQTGFVRQLTLWMFEESARLLADPRTQGMGLRVSVNLSTRDLLDPELCERLQAMLARHRVAPQGFCLEITESAIMDDPLRAEAMLNRLSQQGFKLSIDDFGTGYSSLGYLKRLPVDELKIDKSFVMGMEEDPDDAIIVRSTIDLAHNLGLSVVAEGVENAAILERLRDLHCDEAQGYHVSRPLPVDAFLSWQAQRAWAQETAR